MVSVVLGVSLLALVLPTAPLLLQSTGTLLVRVVSESGPLEHATVRIGQTGADTNAAGEVELTAAAGPVEIVVERFGYGTKRVTTVVKSGAQSRDRRRARGRGGGRGERGRDRDANHAAHPGSSAAGRSRSPGGNRREAVDDAGRRGDDADRDQWAASAGDVAVHRRRERPRPGAARPLHADPLGRTPSLRSGRVAQRAPDPADGPGSGRSDQGRRVGALRLGGTRRCHQSGLAAAARRRARARGAREPHQPRRH